MTGDENPTGYGEMISGRVTEILRVGDTVRRPLNDSTESMRQLLVHLERVGFDGAPRVVDTELDDTMVIAGCHRSVARKAAAGIPAFVRIRDEGALDELDNQRQAAENYRSLIVDAALRMS